MNHGATLRFFDIALYARGTIREPRLPGQCSRTDPRDTEITKHPSGSIRSGQAPIESRTGHITPAIILSRTFLKQSPGRS